MRPHLAIAPLRRVTRYEFSQSPYTKPGWGQNILVLECTHRISQKTSIPIPRRTRCTECADAIANASKQFMEQKQP